MITRILISLSLAFAAPFSYADGELAESAVSYVNGQINEVELSKQIFATPGKSTDNLKIVLRALLDSPASPTAKMAKLKDLEKYFVEIARTEPARAGDAATGAAFVGGIIGFGAVLYSGSNHMTDPIGQIFVGMTNMLDAFILGGGGGSLVGGLLGAAIDASIVRSKGPTTTEQIMGQFKSACEELLNAGETAKN